MTDQKKIDPGQDAFDTQTARAGVVDCAADHVIADAQDAVVGGVLLELDPGHAALVTHQIDAGVVDRAAAQGRDDTHHHPGGGSVLVDHSAITEHGTVVGQRCSVDDPAHPPVGQSGLDDQTPPADGWMELRIWCAQREDAMAARIAAVNRAERGGVDPVIYETYIESLRAAEHVCELELKRCYRRVVPPEIIAWQKAERGIGELLTARLLGHLGDPCIATPYHWEGSGADRRLVPDEPYVRTVSQLWQYSGVGDPARRRHRGMSADEAFALGNPAIKSLLFLHAQACLKAQGRYADVYYAARETYADRTHAVECVRCGPSGKPAPVGSPWSKGHQQAAAFRKVAKEILRDLWRVRHAAICPPIMDLATPNPGSSAGTFDSEAA